MIADFEGELAGEIPESAIKPSKPKTPRDTLRRPITMAEAKKGIPPREARIKGLEVDLRKAVLQLSPEKKARLLNQALEKFYDPSKGKIGPVEKILLEDYFEIYSGGTLKRPPKVPEKVGIKPTTSGVKFEITSAVKKDPTLLKLARKAMKDPTVSKD